MVAVDYGYVTLKSLYLPGLCICLMSLLDVWITCCEVEGLKSLLEADMIRSLGGSKDEWSMTLDEGVGIGKTMIGSGLFDH